MATISANLPQPIDYSIDVKMPFEASLEGFKLGSDVATIQAAQQKRLLDQQAMQQTQARQAELGTRLKSFYNKKPEERNFEEIEQLFAFAGNKDQLDALKSMAEGMDKRRLDTDKRFYAQVMLGLESEPTVAFKLLDDRILAEKDPGQKAALQAIKRTAETVNPAAAVNLIEPYTATIFGKDWYAGLKDARGERRLQDLAPSALQKSMADSEEAVAKAKTAQATAKNADEKAAADAAKATADAQQAAVKAKYAEREAVDAIVKRAADLGLTKAQTNEVLAKTSKLGIETKKAVLELENFKKTGGADTAKVFEQEEKLRKEFQNRTKVYGELGTTFSNIKASSEAKTGPGDIALITGFMKMLDPGSVVRETEFATARDTAGLYERLLNTSQKLQSGQLFTLDSKQRQEYVNLAQQYLNAAQKKAAQDKRDLSAVVTNYKLNPENVFGVETVGGGRGTVNPPVPEQRNVTVDY
jgi:hypothetical protein